MGDDQRLEKWASGILGVVSLLLVLNLARIYAGQWRAVLPARAAAHGTKPLTRNPQPARPAAPASMDSARVEPAFADSARIKQGATNLARVEPGAPVVVIERVARGYDRQPLEWRRSRGPADRFHYRVELR